MEPNISKMGGSFSVKFIKNRKTLKKLFFLKTISFCVIKRWVAANTRKFPNTSITSCLHWAHNLRFERLVFVKRQKDSKNGQKIQKLYYSEGHIFMCKKIFGKTAYAGEFSKSTLFNEPNSQFCRWVFQKTKKKQSKLSVKYSSNRLFRRL